MSRGGAYQLGGDADLTRSGGGTAALFLVMTDEGKITMDGIRDTIATMQAVEDRRAADAFSSAATARSVALGSVAALTALAVFTLVVLVYVARRSFAQISASEQRLAITLSSIGDAVNRPGRPHRDAQASDRARALEPVSTSIGSNPWTGHSPRSSAARSCGRRGLSESSSTSRR